MAVKHELSVFVDFAGRGLVDTGNDVPLHAGRRCRANVSQVEAAEFVVQATDGGEFRCRQAAPKPMTLPVTVKAPTLELMVMPA